jgi:hypothetical protein
MDKIEITGPDGSKSKYYGSFDPDTRTVSKDGGGKVHVGGNSVVETTPVPIGLIIIGFLLLAAWCSG